MLAADAGAAITNAPDTSSIASPAATESVSNSSRAADSRAIVFIDPSIGSEFDFAAAIPDDASLVVLDVDVDPIKQITEQLSVNENVSAVHIISHGSSGELRLGNFRVDSKVLNQRAAEIASWRNSIDQGADLLIYGCDVAANIGGRAFVDQLAELTGMDVAASTDKTGHSSRGGDWDLEVSTGRIEHLADLNRHRLKDYANTLSIDIYAAGDIGDEVMQLQIGDDVVATFELSGTNASQGLFNWYSADISNVSADDVRVNFVNDFYDPETGFDRNLHVDKVVIDGKTFQTEHPSVYSTGVWRPEDGIVPGYRQSELLSSGGYFQYSSLGAEGGVNGTTIEIDALGDSGQEQMQLLIDGSVVQTYDNIPTSLTTYTYSTSDNITADRISIRFTNDFYDPATGYDQNLNVNRIRVNGQTFETESPTTYSDGQWVEGIGVLPGYYETETLFANGSFYYLQEGDQPSSGEGGSFVLTSDFKTVWEGQSSVTMTIDRVGGSDGFATVYYSTESETASEGSDFVGTSGSLTFASGETRKFVTIPLLDDTEIEGTETFSFRLTGADGANLLAPRTSTINYGDNDQGLPVYRSFASGEGLQLNGNARLNGGKLQLTAAAPNQTGSAYFTTPVSIDANTSFHSFFTIRFTGGQGGAGGEGLAFVIQNSPGGPAGQNVGNYPGALGYNASQRTVAIELDTFQNSYEQYADEITLTINGVMVTPTRTIQSPFNLNDGRVYYTWIEYNGDSENLAVYVNDKPEKPEYALIKHPLRLNEIVGNQAYVGFSAATGASYNNTFVNSWVFTLDTPASDPPTIPTGELVKNTLFAGLNQPLNIEWSSDGRNMYVAEKAGIVKVSRDGGALQTVLNIADKVNNNQDRGLVDIVLHPDLENNPYLYLNYTVDPPQVYNNVGNPLAGPDGSGNRAGRLVRMTLDASTGYTTVVPNSEVILLGSASTWNNFNAFVDSTLNISEPPAGVNPDGSFIQDFINSDSRSHTVGGLTFGLDGALYVGIGDGASFNQTDPRALRVQNINSLSGKILRINPITGEGLGDNPFYNDDPNANRSKVYQYGLRNPWRLATDPTTGRIYIGETGLVSFEEINTGGPGTNFGWPYYEGGQGVNQRTPSYQGLPQAQAFYNSGAAASPGFIAQPHTTGTDVIVLGSIGDENTAYGPQYDGDVFYLDFASGTVRVGDVDASGRLSSISTFTNGATFSVDLRQGPDGYLYYADIVSGTIGKFLMV